jgi:hypothetical protein
MFVPVTDSLTVYTIFFRPFNRARRLGNHAATRETHWEGFDPWLSNMDQHAKQSTSGTEKAGSA